MGFLAIQKRGSELSLGRRWEKANGEEEDLGTDWPYFTLYAKGHLGKTKGLTQYGSAQEPQALGSSPSELQTYV